MITNLFTTDKKTSVPGAGTNLGFKKSSTFLSAGRPTVNDKSN